MIPRREPYAGRIATHYETLGVDPSATPELIRTAYRNRAREHHPDRAAGLDDAMAAVNEAYRVLSDPARRFEYDRSIGAHGSAAGPARPGGAGSGVGDDADRPSAPMPPSRLMPPGPAKVPWKMMAVMAVVGSAVILIAAAFNDSPSTEVPDGILRVGSCVEVEQNFDVREVACTGTDDLVVDLFLPTDATCPIGLGQFRDRLGLGAVCIEMD